MFHSRWRHWFGGWRRAQAGKRRRKETRRPEPARPRLEQLEDRFTPAAPVVTLTAPLNNSFINNNMPTLTATASETGGSIATLQFQYSTNGTSWTDAGTAETAAPFSYTFPSPLPDGTYDFRAVATDTTGNVSISNSGTYAPPVTLGTFYGSAPASDAGLLEDATGDLFGTTAGGGALGAGTVFEVAAGSGIVTTLASFDGTNGANPYGCVVADASGDLFGTTTNGGASGDGTVFELAAGSGAITTLASFSGTNGASPTGGIVIDGSGNLFGTTQYGGDANGDGTVFELAAGSGAITTLALFNNIDGANPVSELVEDSGGNLFGTASAGGAGYGTVFEVAAGSSAITALASFNSSDGSIPEGRLVEDPAGDLFSTTNGGGASSDGTVFEVAAGSGAITTLASFDGSNDGAYPVAGLAVDSSGNLYGTTNSGGASGYGTVFEVPAGSTSISVLASFTFTNGDGPEGELVVDGSGNLFGTNTNGGAANAGTVFEVAAGSGAITQLAAFSAASGAYPSSSLIQDASGNFYGTTYSGGEFGDGTVFEMAAGSTAITTLASFNGSNGANPGFALVQDSGGNIYGTTVGGGASSDGTVFELAAGSNSITVLASFTGTNGANPYGGMVVDSGGDLFGTTAGGGANSDGTVFEVAAGTGAITDLVAFDGLNGSNPYGGLIEDANGDLFGTTETGAPAYTRVTSPMARSSKWRRHQRRHDPGLVRLLQRRLSGRRPGRGRQRRSLWDHARGRAIQQHQQRLRHRFRGRRRQRGAYHAGHVQ